MMMVAITIRTRSIYSGDEAQEFLKWLQKRLDELTPQQRVKAVMECRSVDKDFVMVGISYTDE
jgi:hypothetical protein